jgi:hypothetical protein
VTRLAISLIRVLTVGPAVGVGAAAGVVPEAGVTVGADVLVGNGSYVGKISVARVAGEQAANPPNIPSAPIFSASLRESIFVIAIPPKGKEPISNLTLCARRVKSRNVDERRIRKIWIKASFEGSCRIWQKRVSWIGNPT